MKRATVFLGLSNSGKDYQANLRQLPVLKFAKPAKRLLAKLFGFDESVFEDKQKRAEAYVIDEVTGAFVTPLAMLIRLFELTRTQPDFGYLFRLETKRELIELLLAHDHIAFTDIRQVVELDWLIFQADKYDIELDFVLCKSSKQQQLVSDYFLGDLLNKVIDLGYSIRVITFDAGTKQNG